jgi:putative membrane protein
MTRTLLLCAAAAAALSLAACNKNQASNQTPATPDVNAVSNTSSAGQAEPVNKAQDATGAAVGTMSAATLGSHDTGAFVSNAAQSDMYEIQAGQVALQKSKNPDVKAFAKQMIKDHTALTKAMTPLIKAAGQTPPADLDQRRKGFLDNLKAADAGSFDKTYIDQQVAAHDEALTLMQGYAKDGSDAGLKAGAAKAVPTVQMHSDMAKKLQAKISGAKG